MHILYIPSSFQDRTVNWQSECCKELRRRKFQSVTLLNLSHEQHISLMDFWTLRWRKKKTDTLYFEILPFRSQKRSRDCNLLINLLIKKIQLFRRYGLGKFVLITGQFNEEVEQVQRVFRPQLTIGEICDALPKPTISKANLLSDVIAAYSKPQLDLHHAKKDRVLIPGGFYTDKQLVELHRKFKYQARTVIYITTVSHFIDFVLLAYCMDHLPEYKFHFYYAENFSDAAADRKSKKEWQRIQRKSNFFGFKVANQAALSRVAVRGSVGILAYELESHSEKYFNQFRQPIKFFNYLAVGVPVVSVPLLSLEPYRSKIVLLPENARDFCKAIETASQRKISRLEKNTLLKFALQQSIEEKSDAFEALIRQRLSL